jgi:hypothetical protein
MHKTMPHPGRALALECGHAMHEVFAWVRLCTLSKQIDSDIDSLAAFQHHGLRMFGRDRFDLIIDNVQMTGDHLGYVKSGAIAVLNSSGFYDDPRDKRRTLTNMEEAALVYVDRWRWDQPVWIRDHDDPCGDVGIEIPFDMVVDLNDYQFRLTGRIDGIHDHFDGVRLHENKTAARLNDAWQNSFHMSSQITGYCIAASTFTGRMVTRADVIGISIPMPKTYEYGGYIRDTYSRHDYHFERWISWLDHTITMALLYENNPYDAPKYTHSCNRYFRPCSFIPFCDSSDQEQREMVAEMVTDEWSPLNKVEELD